MAQRTFYPFGIFSSVTTWTPKTCINGENVYGLLPCQLPGFQKNRGVGIAIDSADQSKEQHAVVRRHSVTVAGQLLLDTMKEAVEKMEMEEPEASNRPGRACTLLVSRLSRTGSGHTACLPYTRMQGALLMEVKGLEGKKLASAGSTTPCYRTTESKTNRQ